MNITSFPTKDCHPYPIPASRPRGRGLLLAMLCCCSLLLPMSRPLSAATLIVSNLNDSGPGSLRQTLAVAAPGDTIKFSVQGTISLLTPLGLNKSVQIFGPGETNLLLQFGSPIFDITNAAINVTLSDMTLTKSFRPLFVGELNGGAIRNFGNLTMIRCLISDSGVEVGFGGGIYNLGNLTLQQCTISNNFSEFGGGIADVGSAAWFWTVAPS